MKKLKLCFIFLASMFLISCEKEEEIERFVPTDVIVKIHGNYSVDKVFSFLNSIAPEVDYMYSEVYKSALPADSLTYVLNYLNAKPYTHRGAWSVTGGYLHAQDGAITIFPRLFAMKNQDYRPIG